jgi:hypothetical protein
VREFRTLGSVRGAARKGGPYRNRALLPLRVELSGMAHQRPPHPVGYAQVQTIPAALHRGDDLAAKCVPTSAQPLRPTGNSSPSPPGGLHEPGEPRGSRRVLRAAGGENPPADSSAFVGTETGVVCAPFSDWGTA